MSASIGFGFLTSPPQAELMVPVTLREEVQQSLMVLLSTHPGERPLQPDYGCNLRRYIFERKTPQFFSDVANTVMDAVAKWEPRIEIEEVRCFENVQEKGVEIVVSYKLRENDLPQSFRYPLEVFR